MTLLFLASRSPRRRELLTEAGIPFTLLDVDVDETLPPGIRPEEAVRRLAELKATTAAEMVAEGLVLGADTLVAIDDDILGKPRDRAHAAEMLERLSGADHRVLTGVCLVDAATGARRVEHESTAIGMRAMSAAEIAEYVASGEADDKAGAYAIQETGDRFVIRREGSWSNVVGLPVALVERLLCEMGGADG